MRIFVPGLVAAAVFTATSPVQADLVLQWDGPATYEVGVTQTATLQMVLTDDTTVLSGGATLVMTPGSIATFTFGLDPSAPIHEGPFGPDWFSFIADDPGGLTAGSYDILLVDITPTQLGGGILSMFQEGGNPFQLFLGNCPENPVLPEYSFTVVPAPASALLLLGPLGWIVGRQRTAV